MPVTKPDKRATLLGFFLSGSALLIACDSCLLRLSLIAIAKINSIVETRNLLEELEPPYEVGHVIHLGLPRLLSWAFLLTAAIRLGWRTSTV